MHYAVFDFLISMSTSHMIFPYGCNRIVMITVSAECSKNNEIKKNITTERKMAKTSGTCSYKK